MFSRKKREERRTGVYMGFHSTLLGRKKKNSSIFSGRFERGGVQKSAEPP